MELIKEFFWDIEPKDISLRKWKVRRAVRALVKSGDKIAVLHSIKNNFYKCLPGGGIDNNENLYTALRREIQEEVGCEINITGELGMCIEYISDLDLVSISYVFVAEKTIQTEQRLTKEEIDAGFALEWHTIEETFKLIEKTKTSDKRGGQQMKREFFLLKYFWENNQNKI